MGEVPPVRQGHTQNRVTWFESGKVNCLVRLGTRVRLHIGMFRPKQGLGPIDGQPLHDVHIFATAIVTPSRIPFGVFISKNRPLRLPHRSANEILRGNELDLFFLTILLRLNSLIHLRIYLAQRCVHEWNPLQDQPVFSTIAQLTLAGKERTLCIYSFFPIDFAHMIRGRLSPRMWHLAPKGAKTLNDAPQLVASMAFLRLISGSLELLAAILMMRHRSVETALRINGVLGLVGPTILVLVNLFGIAGLATRVFPYRLALVAVGVLCILLGSRS